MKTFKQWLPDVLAIIFFAVISFAYFFPADIEGRILFRDDAAASKGLGREIAEHKVANGETTRWMNSVFSGMPTYQTSPEYGSVKSLDAVVKAYHLFLPENVWYLFAYLLGFYILLRAFDFRQHLAALGAVLWAFSSYFLIIIAAGHIWKVMALAYLPPMIGGVVLAYRGKYLAGLAVTAIFSAFEVYANHVQMTYYFLFLIAFMIVAYFIDALRNRKLAHFAKATAVCAVGALIGICMNISNLYHTWAYQKESMRGKSELVKKNTANQTGSGLDRDYITQWSYGIGETWTLLVPNTKGGASAPLTHSETAMKHADNTFLEIYQQLGQYWGEQPGTSGPVYVGAFVLMLFVFGLFVVKGPVKWALLAATILSIMLSWGKNFMPLTDFFIDYVPMYAKFRTVASILVVAEFTIPLLAMLALKRIVDEPDLLSSKMKYLIVSFVLTAGVAAAFAMMPGLFFDSFVSSGELAALQSLPQEYVAPIVQNLTEMRKAVFAADCWRSCFIIVLGTLLLLLFKAGKLRASYMVGALVVLCLVDMWQVDKRYLNDGMFVHRSVREAPMQMTETDKEICADKTDKGNFRVLNFASDTFNENETSYFHNSIGGYHAAKLRRYNELITAYIRPEMQKAMNAVVEAQGNMAQVDGKTLFPVLNMLNARYFILPLQEGRTLPLLNPYAQGTAWFVDKLTFVNNANEELDALGRMDLSHEAVADKQFEAQLQGAVKADTTAVVTMQTYKSNLLSYEVTSANGGVLVFSEIYYPGWTAEVDGQPVELGRVNYVLRALRVAPGKHNVTLTFKPKSVATTETIAYSAYALLLLVIAWAAWTRRRNVGISKKTKNM